MEPGTRYKSNYGFEQMQDETPQSFPVVQTPDGPMTQAFGRYWPVQNDISLHLTAWRIGLTKADGGLGPLRHMVEAHNLIWPERAKIGNAWLYRRFATFNMQDKYTIVTLAGGAGTAKSTDVAYFVLLWWWANPEERAALVASTTISALKKRIWSYIAEGLRKARGNMPGEISNSPPPKILFNREDPKHGIHGVALKEGAAERALADVIGIHPTESLLVVIDEASDVTPAVNDAVVNWDDGNGKLHQVIMLANSKSRLDPHGKASEPKVGWNNINPDIDEQWETKVGGICLYFDCYKSPALHAKNKADLQFLIGANKIRKEEKKLGKDDSRFWRFVRGFWPPEDLSKTVLTLALIEKHGARKKLHWGGDWQIKLAGCDPAFTSDGDECILRFATLGSMANGVMGLQFDEILSLSLDMRSKEPVSYQIMRMFKKECLARGVRPEHAGIDTWGFGTGAGDVIEKNWSSDVVRVISVGSPSDMTVDSDMAQTAYEVYDRKATELWFAVKTFVECGQIGGLDDESIEQFCSRVYEWKGRKMCLEGKQEYKKRMGKEDGPTGSPDQADAAAIIIEVARQEGFNPVGREDLDEITAQERWEQKWEEQNGYGKKKNTVEDRESGWNVDAILDSETFAENDW